MALLFFGWVQDTSLLFKEQRQKKSRMVSGTVMWPLWGPQLTPPFSKADNYISVKLVWSKVLIFFYQQLMIIFSFFCVECSKSNAHSHAYLCILLLCQFSMFIVCFSLSIEATFASLLSSFLPLFFTLVMTEDWVTATFIILIIITTFIPAYAGALLQGSQWQQFFSCLHDSSLYLNNNVVWMVVILF